MKRLWIAIALAACGNGEEAGRQAAQEEAARQHAAEAPAPPPPMQHGSAVVPATAAKPAKEPEPEPTTPEQLDHALKQAMIDGRDKDVLRFCEMSKFDDKANPQALLGCTLSACRIKDEDQARRYAKPLAKAYLDQARRVCQANQVSI